MSLQPCKTSLQCERASFGKTAINIGPLLHLLELAASLFNIPDSFHCVWVERGCGRGVDMGDCEGTCVHEFMTESDVRESV